jgi:ABC-2 family transporter protein
MTWVAWRQFRAPGLATIAGLVVTVVLLAVTGTHLHHLYAEYQAQHATCATQNGDCDQLTNAFLRHDHHLFQYLGTLLVAIPGVIGVFWGPPLVARELETGTYRLAWTQGVTRTRWLAVKLGVVGVAAVVAAGLFSLMVTWWARPIDHLSDNRFSAEIFSTRGLVPVGYAVFAFLLGVTLGLLIRRTLPAMAATLVGYVAIHLAIIGWVRPHLAPARHLNLPLRAANDFGFVQGRDGVHFAASGATFPNSLVVSDHLVDNTGHVPSPQAIDQFLHTNCPAIVSPPPGGDPTGGAFNHCMSALGSSFHLDVRVIPASRYWELQASETALYFLLAIALAGACFWWIRHRLT